MRRAGLMPIGRRIAAVLLLLGGAAPAQDTGLYLYHVPVTLGGTGSLPLGARIQADLSVANVDYFASRLATADAAVTPVDAGTVRVALPSSGILSGGPLPRHSAASFVIDFDEPPVAKLLPSLQKQSGAAPSIEALVEFADAAITSKSYRRSFDIASQVARSNEGDCTEHAVLLAALARATGRPARVVLGILLVEDDHEVLAFGHAWTEIHDGEAWRIADATQPARQMPGVAIHYLPLTELDNEGPGYGFGLATFSALQPSRIDAVQTAPN